MSIRIGALLILGVGFLLLAFFVSQPSVSSSASIAGRDIPATSNPPNKLPDESTPVLVELFTSEGCSSCPPADALLARLGRTQPVRGADVIVLEEHVDYWDRLGWKDPFSSEAATSRQSEYGEAFGDNQVYTPQMIVDGRAQFVGNSEGDALRAIRAASQSAKPAISLSWGQGDALAIKIEPFAQSDNRHDDQAELYLALSENMLHSDVKRGENAGRELEHDGVVRQLTPLEKSKDLASGFSSTIALHPANTWNRANLRAVVFVQDSLNRHVVAAAAIPFTAG
jgi:hypothetical protein